MKRMTAYLMAFCLMATWIFPVQAAQTEALQTRQESVEPGSGAEETAAETKEETQAQTGTETETETSGQPEADAAQEKESPSASASGEEAEEEPEAEPATGSADGDRNDRQMQQDVTGGIEVVLMNALPVGQDSSLRFEVSVEGAGSREAVLQNDSRKHRVLFDGLKEGTYRLRIAEKESGRDGFGFLAYEQDIAVSGNVVVAEIYTGFVELEGVRYTKQAPHPGALLIGDVNRDGRIDEADKNAILQEIGRGENGVAKAGAAGNPTDLNKDGQTDLVDLQYYANSRERIKENADTQACLYSRISPTAVQVDIRTENTTAQGDPEGLLLGNGNALKLQPADGGEISETSFVEIDFQMAGGAQQAEQIEIAMENTPIESGRLVVTTADDTELPFVIAGGTARAAGNARFALKQEEGALLTVDLGGRVAIKKVTFLITGLKKGGNLAEISRVEFLNNMENRIPAPVMDIPEGLDVTGGNKSLHATWNPRTNITGYEVKISHDGQNAYVRVAANSLEIKSFLGSRLKNGELYEVSVQSVNGTWASGFCDVKTASPVVAGKPDAPDNLRATGGNRRISLTWKNMEDTDSYNVYYKAAGDSAYSKVTGVTQNRYVIGELKEETLYDIYVTGVNELGESNPSLHAEARTITVSPAQMPEYKLINVSNGKGKVSAHIVSVTHGRGSMVSGLPEENTKSALGTVDKDAGSYYQVLDWDDGACYPSPDKGLIFTLDDYYEMNYIAFAEAEDIGYYSGAYVYYYDREHPEGTAAADVSLLQRADANGRKYYLIKLAQPVVANKLRLGFTRGNNLRDIVISEVNFYYYDSLEQDILALYADDLHTSLQKEVTKAVIDALQKRLDTKDAKSNEYHPERSMLQKELDNARGLLSSDFQEITEIEARITAAKDGHLGFGGQNAWQPLGVTAYEGEQIVVYVGHDRLKTGSNSALKLIATQHHAESGAFATEVATLKIGRNEITIPAIASLACEGGGALYVQYTGNDAKDRYAVRVSGGAKEPVLNLYGVTDSARKKERITAYVKELEEHVAALEEKHALLHESVGGNNKINRAFEKQNCILDATDIMLDRMMLSVSAQQILAGLGKGSLEDKAEKLYESLQAMEDMMELFYQHKGLSDDPSAPATDRMPACHLNIRYMRMFAGAFMYAAGNHIGIEFGSVPRLAQAVPVQADEAGRYISGRYFGWGISHEIGHNINQGSYAIAEVTNNYFAQLTKSEDSNRTVRFDYGKVYKKVTSGTVGYPSDVFTHLAMYWQLHLAYDRGYNYKTYDSYEQQMENLFYARVDSYSRDTSRAKGTLSLNGGSDQNIMRLACAAAQKDLTEFFVRWGLVPDEETSRYAGQFEKEERALYYLTDDARVYEMEHGTGGSIRGRDVIGLGSTVKVSGKIPNEVTLSIQCSADPEVVLGYEIARYCYVDGLPVRQVIGFSEKDTYVDHVAMINNRAVTYEVTAVDKFGYRSNAVRIGEVRIAHDGSLDKSMWTVTTNMLSDADETGKAEEEDPCAPEKTSAIRTVIDYDNTNDYQGQTAGGDARILVRLNRVQAICGLTYTVKKGTPVGAYEIEVSTDGSTWTTVKSGSFENRSKSQTVYFENADQDPWVCTYDAAYVRLTATGQSGMCIAELDLLGPAGDSISFGVRTDDQQGAVGILDAEYTYEEGKTIPKGSLIFTGSYKGNPAYNVVVIYEEDGSIAGGVDEENILKAEQIILANVPENGKLGEVSDGIWIYWIEPEQIPQDIKGKTVRAQLYRVDHALTNEGQRLVSDTLPLRIPDTLPHIILSD